MHIPHDTMYRMHARSFLRVRFELRSSCSVCLGCVVCTCFTRFCFRWCVSNVLCVRCVYCLPFRFYSIHGRHFCFASPVYGLVILVSPSTWMQCVSLRRQYFCITIYVNAIGMLHAPNLLFCLSIGFWLFGYRFVHLHLLSNRTMFCDVLNYQNACAEYRHVCFLILGLCCSYNVFAPPASFKQHKFPFQLPQTSCLYVSVGCLYNVVSSKILF
jgi:hypothetical protein